MTRGAQRVTDADTVAPDQSCLWGFGRAASLELPQVWGGLADLSNGAADEWSRFINRITTPRDSAIKEDQIALRDQAVYVPRLVRRAGQPSGAPLELRDNATLSRDWGPRIRRAGDRRISSRARRQASGADQPTRAQRCRATTHRCTKRTCTTANSASSLPMSPMRMTSHACWPPCSRATAASRDRPCCGRERYHSAEQPGRRRNRSRLRGEGLGCLAFE